MKLTILGFLLLTSCTAYVQQDPTQVSSKEKYSLSDFLSDDEILNLKVDSIFNSLNTNSKIAQLLMPAVGNYGIPEDSIIALIEQQKIGGVLLLNGTKTQFKNWSEKFENLNSENNNLPFLYSADAEPTLFNRKMKESAPVNTASQLTSIEDVRIATNIISDELLATGVNYNFAPVVDVSANKTVGYRGFGSIPENIIPFSSTFIEETQSRNIIATAKHFPGHGLVTGDTHKSLQTIDGELRELENYPPLIEQGVISIMIAHIAVKNNSEYDTKGMPATTSHKIVTELLRDSLEFKGLIVTDAMNMGGVVNVPNCYVLAIDAGCDILLMPKDSQRAHRDLLKTYNNNPQFAEKVNTASKRVIRAKICLGLIN